jgi:hypothetical protein
LAELGGAPLSTTGEPLPFPSRQPTSKTIAMAMAWTRIREVYVQTAPQLVSFAGRVKESPMLVRLYMKGEQSRAHVIFVTKDAEKVRDLACEDRDGETWCSEDDCIVPRPGIKIEKAAMGRAQGLRVFNEGGLRTGDTCDRGNEVLKSESSGDDVFELPLLGSCTAS